VKFEEAFKARGLEVEIVQEKDATPMHAQGKRVIMLSYGMTSTAFKAEAFVDVAVPDHRHRAEPAAAPEDVQPRTASPAR
jgi:hypothetical protein